MTETATMSTLRSQSITIIVKTHNSGTKHEEIKIENIDKNVITEILYLQRNVYCI